MKRRLAGPTLATGIGAALTLAVIGGTAGFLEGRYPFLPPFLAVHFGRGGLANRWARKSYSLVFMPVWVQIALALACGAVAIILLWRASPGNEPAHHASSDTDDARRMVLAAEAVVLLAFVWIAFQGFAATRVTLLWELGFGGLGQIYAQALFAAITASIVIGIRAMAVIGRNLKASTVDGPVWRLKVLYVNPRDPALFVPARHGVGLTLNFGRPIAIVLMALVLLFGIGAPFAIMRLLLG